MNYLKTLHHKKVSTKNDSASDIGKDTVQSFTEEDFKVQLGGEVAPYLRKFEGLIEEIKEQIQSDIKEVCLTITLHNSRQLLFFC